jgi:1,2-phenylacetyl-CoA epoxidase PaaB subunit
MKEFVYDVFARKDRGDQLCHIGYVDAFDEETAKVYAWKTYDEERWFEMCVVERTDIIPVNRDDGPFAKARSQRNV